MKANATPYRPHGEDAVPTKRAAAISFGTKILSVAEMPKQYTSSAEDRAHQRELYAERSAANRKLGLPVNTFNARRHFLP